MGNLYPNVNPNLKNIKLESSDDAIKRGIEINKSFLVEAKLRNKTNDIPKQYNKDDDINNADHYKYLKSIGQIK